MAPAADGAQVFRFAQRGWPLIAMRKDSAGEGVLENLQLESADCISDGQLGNWGGGKLMRVNPRLSTLREDFFLLLTMPGFRGVRFLMTGCSPWETSTPDVMR